MTEKKNILDICIGFLHLNSNTYLLYYEYRHMIDFFFQFSKLIIIIIIITINIIRGALP